MLLCEVFATAKIDCSFEMGKLTPFGVAIILRAMAHLFISHKFIAHLFIDTFLTPNVAHAKVHTLGEGCSNAILPSVRMLWPQSHNTK